MPDDRGTVVRRFGRWLEARWWLGFPVVVLMLGGLVLIQVKLDQSRKTAEQLPGVDELMYFPSGKLLTPIAGEFRSVVADYAWLRAIQYYAYHLVRDQNFEWLGHIIRIVGQLDPKFMEAYRFGAMVLTWDARKPVEAIALLREGIEQNQLAWELPFEAAFTAYLKLKDYGLAAHYFEIAARLPDVWSIVPRWAAVAYQKSGNLELAREIWTQIWTTQQNPKLRDLARRQLLDLLRQELNVLQAAADRFAADHLRPLVSLEELAKKGYVEQVPGEPFGGRYRLRGGKVQSSSVEEVRVMIGRLQRLADRYRSEHASDPAELSDLVQAGYLSELPSDRFGGVVTIEDGKVKSRLELP
jgi:tetratricopeptide (TPR) repeat protein